METDTGSDLVDTAGEEGLAQAGRLAVTCIHHPVPPCAKHTAEGSRPRAQGARVRGEPPQSIGSQGEGGAAPERREPG